MGVLRTRGLLRVVNGSKPSRLPRFERFEDRQLLAVDHVVHISVDGLASAGFESLIRLEEVIPTGNFSNFVRLKREGASTFNARTDFTHTLTLPNHASMLTGRPVLAPTALPTAVYHNWTNNGDPPSGVTLHSNHPTDDYVASVFDVVHDAGSSTALLASKSKFSLFDVSYDATHGAPDADPTDGDNGRDKIDVTYFLADATAVADQFASSLGQRTFDYSFLHLADPDLAGHTFGWGSTEWNDAVQVVDAAIGRIMDAVALQPEMSGSTALIVTTDHGGIGQGHDNPAELSNFRIPFFVWGPDVNPGADLYAQYGGQVVNPGSARPDYTDLNQPIRNGDSGNLALALLNLPPIPGSTINRLHPCATDNSCQAPPPVPTVPHDYGDAPAPFPTLESLGGASHPIEAGFHLGSQIDAEEDGQPHPQAMGDDDAGDDEDGVALLTRLVSGRTAQLSVKASASGLLQTWFDWNADGDWDDSGERVFTNQPLLGGDNLLNIQVPAEAPPAAIAARFRFARQTDVPATGPAESGEVEDYVFQVDTEQTLGTVTARDDSYTLQAGISEFTMRVLANDDGEGQLTVIGVTAPSQGGSVQISANGTELLYTPPNGFIGRETFSYQVRDERTAVGQADVTVEIRQRDIPTRDRVRVRMEARSAADSVIDKVAVGERFWLAVLVQDVRESASGVAAAYLDVAMTGHVTGAGSIQHDTDFADSPSGTFVSGKIDEVGGVSTSPGGGAEQLVFKVPLVSDQTGTIRFELDAADAVNHSIRLVGQETAIPYIYWITEPLELQVVEEPSPHDPLDVDRDGLITPLDALLVINELNQFGARKTDDPIHPPRYPVDVNNDGFVAPIDVLLIINHLNDASASPTAAAITTPTNWLAAAILDDETLSQISHSRRHKLP